MIGSLSAPTLLAFGRLPGVFRALTAIAVFFGPQRLDAQRPDLTKPPKLEIGALDRPPESVFGRIERLAADGRGNIVVLDFMAREIRWFGADGSFRGRAGRQGSGPGEFRYPYGLAIDDQGLIHVLDPGNLRVSVFRMADSTLTLVSSARTIFARRLCTLGPRRFVTWPLTDGVIHEIDANGDLVRTFGIREDPHEEDVRRTPQIDHLLRESANAVEMACAKSGELEVIVLLHLHLPIVSAYLPDGTRLWRTTLADYNRVRWGVSVGEQGGVGMRWGPDPRSGTAHLGIAVAETDDARVFVTLQENRLGSPEGQSQLRELRLRDGHEVWRSRIDFVLGAASGARVYGYTERPFPKVVVY